MLVRQTMFSSKLTRAGLIFLLLALLVSLNLGQRMEHRRSQIVDIDMAIAEQGGFTPAALRVRAGEPVTLRFHGGDVAHAIAIGPGLGLDLGVIAPGETRETTTIVAEPGVYTFYCNLWCSPEHWRMRGVIDVVHAGGTVPPAAADPVIVGLTAAGIDIDAAHHAGHAGAANPFSHDAFSLELLPDLARPDSLSGPDWQRTLAPADAFAILRRIDPGQPETAIAATAAAWWVESSRSNPDLGRAADLYAKNCASCHGASGQGDGMAAALATTAPVAFIAANLADRRSDVLYAKIRRGGMGTGMPNFGTLFTPAETWALVDYIWLLALGSAPPGRD